MSIAGNKSANTTKKANSSSNTSKNTTHFAQKNVTGNTTQK
jgi:hypothetical protein